MYNGRELDAKLNSLVIVNKNSLKKSNVIIKIRLVLLLSKISNIIKKYTKYRVGVDF